MATIVEEILSKPPTPEQCSANEILYKDELMKLIAMWYPQMGGYVGRCITEIHKSHECFDVYVWHDGKFPFDGEDEDNPSPKRVHHCMTEQFIRFGNNVEEQIQKFKKEPQ